MLYKFDSDVPSSNTTQNKFVERINTTVSVLLWNAMTNERFVAPIYNADLENGLRRPL